MKQTKEPNPRTSVQGDGVLEISAQGRNRTTDTGIFSPLLYRLSYLGVCFPRCSPSMRQATGPEGMPRSSSARQAFTAGASRLRSLQGLGRAALGTEKDIERAAPHHSVGGSFGASAKA